MTEYDDCCEPISPYIELRANVFFMNIRYDAESGFIKGDVAGARDLKENQCYHDAVCSALLTHDISEYAMGQYNQIEGPALMGEKNNIEFYIPLTEPIYHLILRTFYESTQS